MPEALRADGWDIVTLAEPREAARAGGRARDGLEMLLDDLQWHAYRRADAGDPPLMDVAWARRELGLAPKASR